VFKDSKGRPFNFYGLTYSLNVQVEINEAAGNELTL
jgi:predicted transcriptional regulator